MNSFQKTLIAGLLSLLVGPLCAKTSTSFTAPPPPGTKSILPNPSQLGNESDADHWKALFQTQVDNLTAPLGNSLRGLVVDTDDPKAHDFIWKAILKQPDTKAEAEESGLSGMYVGTGEVNGKTQPMCYVLYRFVKAGPTQRQFMMPLTKAYNETIAAAFLMGHEVGHCFDFMERNNAMKGQPSWSAQDASHVGISDVAYTRVFGTSLNDDLYLARFKTLSHDLAQRQYQERVADIFGVFWAWTQGMPKEGVNVIRESRQFQSGSSDHNTLNALQGLESFYKPVMDAKGDLKTLWMIARQIQVQKGVTQAAVAWTPPKEEQDANQSASSDPSTQTVSTIKPGTPVLFGTSHTVAAFGEQPASQNNTGPKNFDDLPRFGQQP